MFMVFFKPLSVFQKIKMRETLFIVLEVLENPHTNKQSPRISWAGFTLCRV
jgi:hypothetical protein